MHIITSYRINRFADEKAFFSQCDIVKQGNFLLNELRLADLYFFVTVYCSKNSITGCEVAHFLSL